MEDSRIETMSDDGSMIKLRYGANRGSAEYSISSSPSFGYSPPKKTPPAGGYKELHINPFTSSEDSSVGDEDMAVGADSKPKPTTDNKQVEKEMLPKQEVSSTSSLRATAVGEFVQPFKVTVDTVKARGDWREDTSLETYLLDDEDPSQPSSRESRDGDATKVSWPGFVTASSVRKVSYEIAQMADKGVVSEKTEVGTTATKPDPEKEDNSFGLRLTRVKRRSSNRPWSGSGQAGIRSKRSKTNRKMAKVSLPAEEKCSFQYNIYSDTDSEDSLEG